MSGVGGGRMTSGVDPLTSEQRRRTMKAVRGRDTKPELIVRRALHASGLRYRLHGALPGKPDLVFPGRRAVIFIHGCFWHGHDCPMFKIPATREAFWREKIGRNQARDAKTEADLLALGWRVMTVWECALRGKARRDLVELTGDLRRWLDDGASRGELMGTWGRDPVTGMERHEV